MPELTVAMPSYNTGRYVKFAVESVLAQEGIDFELIVVDDASTDNTAEVIKSFEDPRIKLFRNSKNMGVAYCHNLIIQRSQSPYIAHVDSDDIVLPGAFHKLVGALRNSPSVGQVHCYYSKIDENGKYIEQARHNFWKNFDNPQKPDIDYKRELVIQGTVNNHLRTYRREVFEVVGTFNEKMKTGEDHAMALRLVDQFDIQIVPELLYARRIHDASLSHHDRSQNFHTLRRWLQRYMRCRRLLKNNQVQFLRQKEYNLHKLMLTRLYYLLKLHRFLRWISRLPRRIPRSISVNVLMPLMSRLYKFTVDHFS